MPHGVLREEKAPTHILLIIVIEKPDPFLDNETCSPHDFPRILNNFLLSNVIFICIHSRNP